MVGDLKKVRIISFISGERNIKMQLEKEVARAIRHISATDAQSALNNDEQARLAVKVMDDVKNASCHFENADIIILQQGSKKRLVKRYIDRYSSENVLCQSIKQVLDKDFRVKYPNRNKISRALFSILPATIQMADYTIVRFDFKDYFNSVSAEYAYCKYIQNKISDRLTRDLLGDYCKKTGYTYAGLPTSNAIAEIVASEFDATLKQLFAPLGIIFYSRYIDDSVLVLNRHVDEDIVITMLDNILDKTYHDETANVSRRCKTRYNRNKYSYISKRKLTANPSSFDYLGYEFWLKLTPKGKTEIQYGITQEKRIKYRDRLETIIKLYTDPRSADYQNTELLRHRVLAFTSREVYMGVRHQANIWKSKGFISNYGELRYLLGTELLHPDTVLFLKNIVKDAFTQAAIKPYFTFDAEKVDSGYNLYHNMKDNRTILLVDGIGYDYKSLVKLCSQIGISDVDAGGKRRTYSSLVREYLIRVKVGY